MVAVAADAVGVDIECVRPLADLPALAERCLTADESAALAEHAADFIQLIERGRAYFPDTLPAELE